MKSFLQETAEEIIKNNKGKLDKICIIFPNKRTRMFFRHYFAQVSGQTQWAPQMRAIRMMLRDFTKLNEPDTLSLIYDLFQIFKKHSKQEKEFQTFDKFYKLGEIILNDFNEIDSWLVNPEQLFRNIKNVHEIEANFSELSEEEQALLRRFWKNFSADKQSAEKNKFLEIWGLMPKVYNDFKKSLLERNLGYNGLSFRVLSEKIDNNSLDISKFEKYIFVGFNALNKAEEKFFRYIKEANKATFFWDTDAYYHADFKQEAGDFLRKNFKALNISPRKRPPLLTSSPKKIQLIGVPLEVGQAKIIPKILGDYKAISGEQTAVVLADEHLLFPVMHSLPAETSPINVTMGYPFKATALFSLIERYLQLHTDLAKRKPDTPEFYHKDTIALLRHPSVYENTQKEADNLMAQIKGLNLVYVPARKLIETENPLLRLLFAPLPKENPAEFMLTTLLSIIFQLFNKQLDEGGKPLQTIENEYLHKAYKTVKRFREVLNNKNINLSFLLTADLLMQLLSAEQAAFTGDATEGLQLMGALETRNLDFKNVIIVGMNEGNFPKTSAPNSFISQSVRFAFGMPVIKFQDSVFAYLFYRLIQRAENITFIYNSIVGSGTTGEVSRFVQQLQYESGLEIEHKQFSMDLNPANNEPITIEKTDEVNAVLKKYYTKNGFSEKLLSASGINTYLSCQLQFYFRYIARLRVPDEVEEEISPAVFGQILHAAAENLYHDFIEEKERKLINIEDFKILKKRTKSYINQAFSAYFKIESEAEYQFEGGQIIIAEVMKRYLDLILSVDKKHAPFEIDALEAKFGYQCEIKIPLEDAAIHVSLTGIIDRIDKKDGIYRIIDYKTGSADKKFSTIEDMMSNEKKNLKKVVLQSFVYGLLFKEKKQPEVPLVIPGIYDIRSMSQKGFSPALIFNKLPLDASLFLALLPQFEMALGERLVPLFDATTPFVQTQDVEKCKWCDFTEICGR